jgi:hypothetical protein
VDRAGRAPGSRGLGAGDRAGVIQLEQIVPLRGLATVIAGRHLPARAYGVGGYPNETAEVTGVTRRSLRLPLRVAGVVERCRSAWHSATRAFHRPGEVERRGSLTTRGLVVGRARPRDRHEHTARRADGDRIGRVCPNDTPLRLTSPIRPYLAPDAVHPDLARSPTAYIDTRWAGEVLDSWRSENNSTSPLARRYSSSPPSTSSLAQPRSVSEWQWAAPTLVTLTNPSATSQRTAVRVASWRPPSVVSILFPDAAS